VLLVASPIAYTTRHACKGNIRLIFYLNPARLVRPGLPEDPRPRARAPAQSTGRRWVAVSFLLVLRRKPLSFCVGPRGVGDGTMSEPAVRMTNVGKAYKIFPLVRSASCWTPSGPRSADEATASFWAVRGFDLELPARAANGTDRPQRARASRRSSSLSRRTSRPTEGRGRGERRGTRASSRRPAGSMAEFTGYENIRGSLETLGPLERRDVGGDTGDRAVHRARPLPWTSH